MIHLSVHRPAVGVGIGASASYLPGAPVTNEDLCSRFAVPMAPDEIFHLTGIRQRHFLSSDQATSDLAIEVGRELLGSQSSPKRLILATSSPDQPSPPAACRVQFGLGLPGIPSIDMASACAGFAFALEYGVRCVATGESPVMVLASEARSRFLDFQDRNTSAIFGDGAGGVVLEPCPKGSGFLCVATGSDGRGADFVLVPAGGSRRPASPQTIAEREHSVRMTDPLSVAMSAIQGTSELATTLLEAANLSWSDIRQVVSHQANGRLLQRIVRTLRVPAELFASNVERVGNLGGASLAVLLDQQLKSQSYDAGDHIMLLAVGAGYSAGGAIYRIPPLEH